MNFGTFQGPGLGYVPIWGKPERVTTYTSGTGTYKPTEANAWCYVILVGGGGGGRNTSSSYAGNGGHAGATYQAWIKITSAAGVSYAVGAGGGANNAGGDTTFSTLTAKGGKTGGYSPYIVFSSTSSSQFIRGTDGRDGFWGSGGSSNDQSDAADGYGAGGGGSLREFTNTGTFEQGTGAGAGSGGLIIIADYGA